MTADHQAEIAASVAALQDLGSGYDQALAEGLVERIGAESVQPRSAALASSTVSSAAGSASRRSSGIGSPLRTDRP